MENIIGGIKSWWAGGKEESKDGEKKEEEKKDAGKNLLSFGGALAYKSATSATKTVAKEYDYLFKILMVGDAGVGKSCMLLRFADNTFFENSYISTIGVDFKIRTLQFGNTIVKLQVWDTSGQERFRTITSSYYRGAHGFVVTYGIDNAESFSNVQKWLQEIERYACETCRKVLVGAKCDLVNERRVKTEDGREFADQLGIKFFETSSKTNTNITEVYVELARDIARSIEEEDLADDVKLENVVERKVAQADSSGESFSEEDLNKGMMDNLAKKEKKEKKAGDIKGAKADVNVFRLELSQLSGATNVCTGDPIRCGGCGAIFNVHSKVTKNGEVTVSNSNTNSASSTNNSNNATNNLTNKKDDKKKKEKEEKPKKRKSNKKLAEVTNNNISNSTSNSNNNSNSLVPNTNNSNNSNKNSQEIPQQASPLAQLELAPPIHIKFENCIAVAAGADYTGTVWHCEFCDFNNVIDLDPMEIAEMQSGAMLDFLVQMPKQVSDIESRLVVFCIDISGSMCVTTEVEGREKFMGAEKRQKKAQEIANSLGEANAVNQYYPQHKRNVTFVSRLQCVQASVANQIENLCANSPSVRVCLITFSDEVQLLGDGKQEVVVVSGDKLSAFETLKDIGSTFRVSRTVKEAKKDLLDCLWGLEETGQTALGPALQLSIACASNCGGSTVILCTDGLANKGVGQLEDVKSEVEAKLFYTECGEQAMLYGLTVNVISLIGAECRLEAISGVTETSRGTIERVAATQLQKELSALVDKPVIATGTMAMVCLPDLLHFKGEFADELERRNWLVKDLGTVHTGDECTFSYGFRPGKESNKPTIPFQVQVLHKRLDGTEVLRVATAEIQVTTNREEAEQNANVKVVATHAAQRAATKAKHGDYRAAQLEMRAAQRFMQRANVGDEKVEQWTRNVEEMDAVLRENDEAPVNAKAEKKGAKKSDNSARNINKFSNINEADLF